MAKQSGFHQIRGKVGEHSYYKQTGVKTGLIRSINQGLSARVKTSEEYANTRLNNQEFGAAANVAGLLGKMVTPKFRPMFLPFSQSRMAKEVLRLARENTGSWGQRTVSASQTAQLAAILSAQSKRDFTEFLSFGCTRESSTSINCAISWTGTQASLMAGLGITGLSYQISVINLATGNWSAEGQQMLTGYIENGESVNESSVVDAGSQHKDDYDLDLTTFIPAPGHSAHRLVVAVFMPYRTINSVKHVLQEYCSFVAVEIPAE